MPVYLVVDTESSVRLDDRLRVLVSIAYEVVATGADGGGGEGDRAAVVRASGYDIVRQTPDRPLDPDSLRIHGIDGPTSRNAGKPLRTVIANLAAVVRAHRPTAVVGHDVRGDVSLIVSECLRLNLDPRRHFGDLFGRLVCTKLAATVPCGIPLPMHLCYRFPCDPTLLRLNGEWWGGGPGTAGRGPDGVRLKWPNLAESFDRLVAAAVPDSDPLRQQQHACHDARGDVERCRAVFLCLLGQH